jgi:hypothetical protein
MVYIRCTQEGRGRVKKERNAEREDLKIPRNRNGKGKRQGDKKKKVERKNNEKKTRKRDGKEIRQ